MKHFDAVGSTRCRSRYCLSCSAAAAVVGRVATDGVRSAVADRLHAEDSTGRGGEVVILDQSAQHLQIMRSWGNIKISGAVL